MTSLEEQYLIVSKEIDTEEQSEINYLITSLVNAVTNDSRTDDDKVEERQHLENLIALLSLRVIIELSLIDDGKTEYETQLNEDANEILKKILFIDDEWEINDKTMSDFVDLITVLSPSSKDALLIFIEKHFDIKTKTEKKNKNIAELYSLFVSVANAYKRLGKQKVFLSVLEGFCSISRNCGDKAFHRKSVSDVLSMIYDSSPETVVKIARINIEFFQRMSDEFSGNFYWIYANALQKLNMDSESMISFHKCYSIRKLLYGEDSWYASVAKQEYSCISYMISHGKNEFEYLFGFIKRIENGDFCHVDPNLLKLIEGKTLYIILNEPTQISDLNQYGFWLEKYEEICCLYDDSPEPFLKKRLAKHLKGLLYLEQNNYILAENAFREAIEADLPEGVPEVITIEQIKTDLLLSTSAQNDLEISSPMISTLFGELKEKEMDSKAALDNELKFYTILMDFASKRRMNLNIKEVEEVKKSLNVSCKAIAWLPDEFLKEKRDYVSLMGNTILLMLEAECSDKTELKLYLEALDKIINAYQIIPLNLLQRAILTHITAILAWTIDDDRVNIYFDRVLEFVSTGIYIQPSTKGAMMLSYSTFMAKKGEYNTARMFIDQAMIQMKKMWRTCVKYLDDDRLIKILYPTQLQFLSAYALFRSISDVYNSYERILRFKALASLAGKERNRILNSSKVNKVLVNKIHALQDRIAVLETESQFKDISIEYKKEQEALRALEAKFAQDFPDECDFTSITWEAVKGAIPDNSVVVEYYYCALEYGKRQFDKGLKEPEMGFDIYVIQKKDNNCLLSRITVADTSDLLALSDEFVKILQAESSHSATLEEISKIDDLRSVLFEAFVLPVLSFLDGFRTVYFAPDLNLVNLPFEILYDDEHDRLSDEHTIIRIECARDFLYKGNTENDGSGSLIIGDPQYEIREKELGFCKDDDQNRKRSLDLKSIEIKPLPYSRLEVNQVGRYLGANTYTGFAASKYLLSEKKNYKIIHIATHGYFDSSEERSSMYSSYLLFAGVSNWRKNGKTSSIYGNGILTADEISRQDYRSVELVVLSSCLTGMSEISLSKGFQGMISAFAAAGVHYVISHLWEADDFGTAVFMDAFYYQYAKNNVPPPAALRLAKNYMKNITIGDLRKMHWFDNIRALSSEESFKNSSKKYESMPDKYRPFKSEAFWGGFTCYQCY